MQLPTKLGRLETDRSPPVGETELEEKSMAFVYECSGFSQAWAVYPVSSTACTSAVTSASPSTFAYSTSRSAVASVTPDTYNPAEAGLTDLYDAIKDAGYSPVREDAETEDGPGGEAQEAARQEEIGRQLRLTLFGAALSAPCCSSSSRSSCSAVAFFRRRPPASNSVGTSSYWRRPSSWCSAGHSTRTPIRRSSRAAVPTWTCSSRWGRPPRTSTPSQYCSR